MVKMVAQRIGTALAVLFVVSLVTFCALHVLPGDPAVLMLGLEASPDKLEALREAMGLNRPLPEQYLDWLAGMARGDWGVSSMYGAPVLEVMATTLPVTLALAVYTMAIALVVSVPLGVLSALKPGTFVDGFARTLMQLGAAAPGFWLAILAMLFFAAHLGWFPVSGYTPFSQNPWGAIRSLTLPAVVLAAGECGVLIRTVRTSVMSALERDCMLSAQVKGLTRLRTVVVYALRSALVAPLTVAGMQLAKLVGGTAVIESVFALPGLGRLLISAVEQHDVMLVQGIVIFVTVAVVLVTLLADLLVMAAEPAVRRQGTGEAS